MESAHESELVPHRNCSSRLVTDAGRRLVLRPAHSAVHVDRIARLIHLRHQMKIVASIFKPVISACQVASLLSIFLIRISWSLTMRRSLIQPCFSSLACVMPIVVLVAAGSAVGEESFFGGNGGIVEGLAVFGDLEPAGAIEPSTSSLTLAATSPMKQAMTRQSVPAQDRAVSYRGSEVFALSKTAMPLLVADLEPRGVSVARPMSGRSVGARPSAAWTKSLPTLSESVTLSRGSVTQW